MLVATIEFQGRLVKSSVRQTGERVGPTCEERSAKRAEDIAYSQNASSSGLGIPADRFRQYNVDKLRLAVDAVTVSRRGKITGFSRKSRKRLIDMTARLRSDVGGVMITLTYRRNMTCFVSAKSHLNKFLKYIARKFPEAPIMWRMERQIRGAIHFHILVFGKVWFNVSDATEYWQGITGDESYPDFRYLDGQRAVLAYVSKYVAKLNGSRLLLVALAVSLRSSSVPARLMLQRLLAVWVFGLDIEPYFPRTQPTGTGRHWGYRNKANLPFASRKVVTWYYTSKSKRAEAVYFRYKRYARRAANGKFRIPLGFSGFTLYRDAVQWYRLWCYNLYVDL